MTIATMSKKTCLEVAEAGGIRKSHERGKEVFCFCPWHEDEHASLRIHVEKDCFNCQVCNVGGSAYKLMALLAGADPSDRKTVLGWLHDRGLGNGNGSGNGNGASNRAPDRKIAAVYDYCDEGGVILFQTIRYSPKSFSQRRPKGNGGFIHNLEGVRRVPFRLPQLLTADATENVWIPEGERDVLRIEKEGGVSTTNAMGSGKWNDSYSEFLRARHCVILPDNDDPGRKHAVQVANSLVAHDAAGVRILALPNVPPKGDVSDWFDAGGSLEQLERLAKSIQPFKPAAQAIPEEPAPVIVRLADVTPEAVEWIWRGRLAKGKMTVLIGDPGIGKSSVTMDVASRITRGASWPDGGPAPIGNVLLLTAEEGLADTVRPKIDVYNGDPGRIFALQGIRQGETETSFSLDGDIHQLEKAIDQIGDVRLIVIDHLSAYLGKKDSYKDSEIRGVLGPLALLAERRGVAVLGVMHLTKNSQTQALYRAPGSIAFVAAARAVFASVKIRKTRIA